MQRRIRSVAKAFLLQLWVALLLLVLQVVTAQAGSMDLMLTPVERLDPLTFEPLPFELDFGGHSLSGQPGLYVMQIRFTAQASAGEKGWAGASWNTMTTGFGLSLVPDTWEPNNRVFDNNGPLPAGNVLVYQVNTDAGTQGDLNNISVAIAAPTLPVADPRNKLGAPAAPVEAGVPGSGTGYPSWLGNFLVQWDGFTFGFGTEVVLKDRLFAFTSTNGTATPADDTFLHTVAGASESFRFYPPPPPPVEVVDQDLGKVRRGEVVMTTFTTTNWGTDLFDWTIDSFNGSGATIDPQTAKFSWDSSGAPLGQYTAVIRAQHFEIGGDTGMLTFNLVPEPSTVSILAMFVLTMVGLMRCRPAYCRSQVRSFFLC